jgi:uncharacterized protein (DUF885 family)
MELCDQYIHELIQLVPELNDFHQLPEYSHLRPNYVNTLTKEFQKKERELIRKYYKLVKQKQELSFYDKVFYEDLKIMIQESKYLSLDHVPIDALNNFPIYYVSGLEGETDYEFTDKQSYLDYLHRFKGIPEITTTIIDNMRKGIKHKDTLPRLIVLDLRDQYKTLLEMNLEEINVPTHVKKDVIQSIETYVIPSVNQLQDFLENEYLCKCTDKLGLSSISGGMSIYKGLLEEQTIKGYTPKQVHDLGLREVKRIVSKLMKLKRKMKFKGNLLNFYEHCSTNFKQKKDIISYSNKLQTEIYQKIYPKYFHADLDIKDLAKIEQIKSNKSRMYAFYIGTKKRGTFYVNTNIYKELNKHELLTLTLHESVPGHHLQLITHNRDKDLPLYIQGSNNTGYCEGWALYCENFTDLHTDKEMVSKYMYELQRAVRLVVDTGIHAFNWSYTKSFNYMKRYLNYSDELIKNEIIRYACIPSQALSYKVGELTMLFLRDQYLKKYPDKLKDFHKLIFDIGPCSLELLIKEFIKRNI